MSLITKISDSGDVHLDEYNVDGSTKPSIVVKYDDFLRQYSVIADYTIEKIDKWPEHQPSQSIFWQESCLKAMVVHGLNALVNEIAMPDLLVFEKPSKKVAR